MNVLVLNPGGNSLKVELISCSPGQQFAFRRQQAAEPDPGRHREKTILIRIAQGKKIEHTEPMQAKDYGEAAANFSPGWKRKTYQPLRTSTALE